MIGLRFVFFMDLRGFFVFNIKCIFVKYFCVRRYIVRLVDSFIIKKKNVLRIGRVGWYYWFFILISRKKV